MGYIKYFKLTKEQQAALDKAMARVDEHVVYDAEAGTLESLSDDDIDDISKIIAHEITEDR